MIEILAPSSVNCGILSAYMFHSLDVHNSNSAGVLNTYV